MVKKVSLAVLLLSAAFALGTIAQNSLFMINSSRPADQPQARPTALSAAQITLIGNWTTTISNTLIGTDSVTSFGGSPKQSILQCVMYGDGTVGGNYYKTCMVEDYTVAMNTVAPPVDIAQIPAVDRVNRDLDNLILADVAVAHEMYGKSVLDPSIMDTTAETARNPVRDHYYADLTTLKHLIGQ